MSDLISRQAAIDAVEKKIRYTDHDEPVVDWNDFVAALCFLPSAQQERKTGQWKMWKWYTSSCKDAWTEEFQCSECNFKYGEPEWNFCPNCGARTDGDNHE